jgi:hypothetical protein
MLAVGVGAAVVGVGVDVAVGVTTKLTWFVVTLWLLLVSTRPYTLHVPGVEVTLGFTFTVTVRVLPDALVTFGQDTAVATPTVLESNANRIDPD